MTDDERLGTLFLFFVALVLLIACATLSFLNFHYQPIDVRVTNLRWHRYINVEKFKMLEQDSLEIQVPADAYEVRKYNHTYYVSETCKIGDISYECGEYVTDKRAKYYVNRWVYDHTLESNGTPKDERQYPVFIPAYEEKLGALREQNRWEDLCVDFKAPFGDITYVLHDYNVWKSYNIEHIYTVDVNHFNQPNWETLK